MGTLLIVHDLLVFGVQGLIEIGALWGAIAGTIYTFYPVNKYAAGLLVPYIAWVSLATGLTYCIWRDNKDRTD
jgi:tryptophan-rich sensory protein